MRHRPIHTAFLAAAIFCTLAPIACEDRTPPPSPPPPVTARPDNTAVNQKDRSGTSPTPMDQKGNAEDLRITADIRKAIMSDRQMSVNGQNCKVITMNGAVTLRGPVDSAAEKDSIETKAKAVAGVTSVTNELEVKPK